MKTKKGISLIVLVITIIVMIILAAAVVVSLSSTGIINKAGDAVEATDLAQVQNLAALAWAEAYTDGIRDDFVFQKRVEESLKNSNVSTNKYSIVANSAGVVVLEKEIKLNEYGFYYDAAYTCNGYQGDFDKANATAVFRKDGSIELHILVTTRKWEEGKSLIAYDFAGNAYVRVTNLEYNKVYTGTGTAGAECSVYIDEQGNYRDVTKIPGSTCVVSEKQILIGGTIPVKFSEDGKSFVYNEQTFILEE